MCEDVEEAAAKKEHKFTQFAHGHGDIREERTRHDMKKKETRVNIKYQINQLARDKMLVNEFNKQEEYFSVSNKGMIAR